MKHLLLTALVSVILPSCAYMQTNKNVAEMGTHYVGAEISAQTIELCSGAGQWYLAAPKVLLERHYPIIYDTIYLNRNNEPEDRVIENNNDGSKIYMPISAGTATVLQRTDGYADLTALLSESNSSNKHALEDLPAARQYTIKAQIESKNEDSIYYVFQRVPDQPSSAAKFWSTLDKYTVDAIGTVLYNICIPVIAPFHFFSEFFAND